MLLTPAQLTQDLGGRWNGHSGIAFCPAHNNHRTPALSISVGDNGTLLLHCFSGCAFSDIAKAINARGHELPRAIETPPSPHNTQNALREKARRSAQARMIWEETQAIANTPAERYLRSRGISSPLPETLRYHPQCWHGPSAHRHPAMIALVEGSSGMAIHRTYLAPDGVGKAKVDHAKMMLGTTAGGAVRLTENDDNGPHVIAEGIETALSLGCGLLSTPGTIWAALSAPGMAKVVLPRRAGALVVAMDGDDAGRKAGFQLAQRADSAGWQVSLLDAPDGRDWNDVLIDGGVS